MSYWCKCSWKCVSIPNIPTQHKNDHLLICLPLILTSVRRKGYNNLSSGRHQQTSGDITVEKWQRRLAGGNGGKSHMTAELRDASSGEALNVCNKIQAHPSINCGNIPAWSHIEDWHTDFNIPAAVLFFQPLNCDRWQLFLSFIPP